MSQVVKKESRKGCIRACDNCRRMKIKCDGKFPCLKCFKHGRDCTFSSGKDKQTTSSLVIEENTERFSYNENDQTNRYIVTEYIQHFMKTITKSLVDASYIPHLLAFDSTSGVTELIRYSALSVSARSFGDLTLSEQFYLKAQHSAKLVYDDFFSNPLDLATGFLFLSWAASNFSNSKVYHYASTAVSFISSMNEEKDEISESKKFLIAFCLCEFSEDLTDDVSGHVAKIKKFIYKNAQGEFTDDDIEREGKSLFMINTPTKSKYPNIWKFLELTEKLFVFQKILYILIPHLKLAYITDRFRGQEGLIVPGSVPPSLCRYMIRALERIEPYSDSLGDQVTQFLALKCYIYQALGEAESVELYSRKLLDVVQSQSKYIGPCIDVIPGLFVIARINIYNQSYELSDSFIQILSSLSNTYPLKSAINMLLYLRHKTVYSMDANASNTLVNQEEEEYCSSFSSPFQEASLSTCPGGSSPSDLSCSSSPLLPPSARKYEENNSFDPTTEIDLIVSCLGKQEEEEETTKFQNIPNSCQIQELDQSKFEEVPFESIFA